MVNFVSAHIVEIGVWDGHAREGNVYNDLKVGNFEILGRNVYWMDGTDNEKS